jgi:hypothetical protein
VVDGLLLVGSDRGHERERRDDDEREYFFHWCVSSRHRKAG